MRKNAGDKEWKVHKPPSGDECCPWLSLFDDCVSSACKRCQKGAQKVPAKTLAPVRAAFEEAAKQNEAARQTLSLFKF